MVSTEMNENFLQFCKGLANANRQHILFSVFVDKQEHTVGEIAHKVGIANSTASEHLTILKNAGVLVSEKRDREVYYQVNKDVIREYVTLIETWLTCC
jgi:DNA-binding transcriptional ArsR family regulator